MVAAQGSLQQETQLAVRLLEMLLRRKRDKAFIEQKDPTKKSK